jgi:DNA primase
MQENETTKYVIYATITAEGVIERPDVVGAVFGQTEGLLGEELDLRDLQKTGRIGRIEVNVESKGGKSKGEIIIPSSLDKTETAILAAALETIDRVGPCTANIEVSKVEDVRSAKRRQIVDRARHIVQEMFNKDLPESQEITNGVRQAIRVEEIRTFGDENLPAGPNIEDSDAILIVEGRADVLTLLRHGIKNTVAVEGTNIPKSVIDLSKKKTVTVFVDGDRGGELLLKELLQTTEIDYVAKAPSGKSVEDLTQKEIVKSLRNKVPVDLVAEGGKKERKEREEKKEKKGFVQRQTDEELKTHIGQLEGTLCARLLNAEKKPLKEVAVRDLVEAIKESDGSVNSIVFDGIITQRIVDAAAEKNISCLAGAKLGNVVRTPASLKILTARDL